MFNDFENRMAASEGRLYSGPEPTQSQRIARQLFEVVRDFLFLLRVSELKIRYIVEGLQRAISDENPTVEFALLRSLVEHASALCFQTDAISGLEKQLIGQNSRDKIYDILESSRRKVNKLFYGRSRATVDNPARFHISDFLRAFEKRVNGVQDSYDDLCDFVHPNYGSNLLVSTGMLGAGYLDPTPDVHAEHMQKACTCALRMLLEVEDLTGTAAAALARLDDYVTIATTPNQRPGAIFVLRPLNHDGEGQSKETAIFFARARTHSEAVAMTYRYLDKNQIRVTGPQSIGAIEDGFVFDVLPTTRGRLWFKVRME